MKWYEQLKNQCPKCKKYLALELVKEGRKYYYFTCKFCGFKRRSKILWAEYKHENGKRYLRTDDCNDYKEVELIRGKKGLEIKEVGFNKTLI